VIAAVICVYVCVVVGMKFLSQQQQPQFFLLMEQSIG